MSSRENPPKDTFIDQEYRNKWANGGKLALPTEEKGS